MINCLLSSAVLFRNLEDKQVFVQKRYLVRNCLLGLYFSSVPCFCCFIAEDYGEYYCCNCGEVFAVDCFIQPCFFLSVFPFPMLLCQPNPVCLKSGVFSPSLLLFGRPPLDWSCLQRFEQVSVFPSRFPPWL